MDTYRDVASEPGPWIDVHEPRNLGYWCRELGLSAEQLRHVVEATGASVEKVRDFVRRPPAPRKG
jgi:hypothetical protein